MIRYFCDRCGTEIIHLLHRVTIDQDQIARAPMSTEGITELCQDCIDKLNTWLEGEK